MTCLVHVEVVRGTAIVLDQRWAPGAEPPRAERAVVEAVRWLHEVDRVFSTWRPDSDVSRLRRGEIGLGSCVPMVRAVVQLCVQARRMSAGWFDPWRMPGGFDPTGLVKGWAAQETADRMAVLGVRHVSVNAGGDVWVAGSASGVGTGGWTVGVTDPQRPQTVLTTVTMSDGAVATSGGYERGSLAINPFTGVTVAPLLSATVVGPDLAIADALATAATAAGDQATAWLDAATGYNALVVLPDGEVRTTSMWSGAVAGHHPQVL
jgi:thiamine biosynthesis lipoprotein